MNTQCKYTNCNTKLSEIAYKVSPFCFVHHKKVSVYLSDRPTNGKTSKFKRWQEILEKHIKVSNLFFRKPNYPMENQVIIG